MEGLYNFMDWGDYNQKISELAAMAIPEPWNFADRKDNSILKNYMSHTFERLQEENKVFITSDICLFNTGLFTPYYESIYVYADIKGTDDDQHWKFRRFLTDYDVGSLGIKNAPPRANYFGDPSLLVLNCNYPINVQYRHILEDAENLRRLPEVVTSSSIPLNMLKGAIDTSIRKVMANYKLAVPQYFNGKIQLLIPLYFTDDNKPDLALVVTRQDGGFYQGHTCITIEMAYNNARLIAKPDSNWLMP